MKISDMGDDQADREALRWAKETVIVSIAEPGRRFDIEAVELCDAWCVHPSREYADIITVTHRPTGLAALKLDFGAGAPGDLLGRVVEACRKAGVDKIAGYVPAPLDDPSTKALRRWFERLARSFGCKRGDGAYFRVPA